MVPAQRSSAANARSSSSLTAYPFPKVRTRASQGWFSVSLRASRITRTGSRARLARRSSGSRKVTSTCGTSLGASSIRQRRGPRGIGTGSRAGGLLTVVAGRSSASPTASACAQTRPLRRDSMQVHFTSTAAIRSPSTICASYVFSAPRTRPLTMLPSRRASPTRPCSTSDRASFSTGQPPMSASSSVLSSTIYTSATCSAAIPSVRFVQRAV